MNNIGRETADRMQQENHQKIKLLKIMEILRQETDEEHPITKAALCNRLVSMNISCNIRILMVNWNRNSKHQTSK